jgi:phage gpG-like protein
MMTWDAPPRDTVLISGIGEMQPIVAQINYEPMLREFLYEVAEEKDQAFTNQSTVHGEPWAELAESTVKRKKFTTILVDTGALRTSLVDIGGEGNVSAVSSHGLLYGTDVEYAIFHETGTATMPARPIMGMSEELVDKLAGKVADVTADQVADQRAISFAEAGTWIRKN